MMYSTWKFSSEIWAYYMHFCYSYYIDTAKIGWNTVFHSNICLVFFQGRVLDVNGNCRIYQSSMFWGNRGCYSLCHFICYVSNSLFSLLNDQCEHNCAEKKQPSALHANVPIPQSFGFCRVLLISHNYHAEGLYQEENNYSCAWLWGPVLYCNYIWVSWVLPGGCHGLWPLWSRLLTSDLLHTDVLYSLNPSNGSFLPRWMQNLRYLLVIA